MGITDSPVRSLSENDDYPADGLAADRAMIEKESLGELWRDVIELPRAQRCALLMNLRDAGGNGVIELIPATGTASFESLAEVLEITSEALARLWPDLPLEDARIAEMLGLSRQQVINLRKSARERLFRRRRKAGGNTGPGSASPPISGLGGPGFGTLVSERIKSIFGRRRLAE
jgi:hypothetical protein